MDQSPHKWFWDFLHFPECLSILQDNTSEIVQPNRNNTKLLSDNTKQEIQTNHGCYIAFGSTEATVCGENCFLLIGDVDEEKEMLLCHFRRTDTLLIAAVLQSNSAAALLEVSGIKTSLFGLE